MTVQLSPGVVVREFDFSQVVQNVGTSAGALVGQFKWGPAFTNTIIDTEENLVKVFGKPTDSNYIDWFSASNFLAYTKNLNIIRAISDNALNATPDDMHVDISTQTGTINLLPFSNELTNNWWVNDGSTVTKNATTSGLPLTGFGNAFDVVQSTDTTAKFHYIGFRLDESSSSQFTMTFYAKPMGNTTNIRFDIQSEIASKFGLSVEFALISSPTATATVMSPSTSLITSGNITATITKLTSWYKCQVSVTSVPSHIALYSNIFQKNPLYPGSSPNPYQFNGVAGDGVSLFAPQLENGTTSSTYVMTGALKPLSQLKDVVLTGTAGVGHLIKNDVDFLNDYQGQSNASLMFTAKHPGALGNSLVVSIADNANFNNWKYKSLFDTKPTSSQYAKNLGADNDELHLVVVDEDGLFSGVKGTVLESFSYLSKASDARGVDNSSIFYGDVINNQSAFVRYLGPVVSSRMRNANYIKAINLSAFGSGYTPATTNVIIDGDGTDATATAVIVNGALASASIGTNTPATSEFLHWMVPLDYPMPLASGFKIPLTFTITTTSGTPATGYAAYATLGADGKVETVTVTNPGSGGVTFVGTVTAQLTALEISNEADPVYKGYTTDATKTTILHRVAGTSLGIQDGFFTVATGANGAITGGTITVTNPVSVFEVRSAVNWKMPASFSSSDATSWFSPDATGTVGSGTKGYLQLDSYGQLSSIVITDPGEGWSGGVLPWYNHDRGLPPDSTYPAINPNWMDQADPNFFNDSITRTLTWAQFTTGVVHTGGPTRTTAISNGAIRSVIVTNPGSDFTNSTIIITDSGSSNGQTFTPGGTGAIANAVLSPSANSQDWAQTAVDYSTNIPRHFKSLKVKYGGVFSFSGGSDGSYVDAGKYIQAWNIFRNKEEIDISLIVSGDCGQYSFTSDQANIISQHLIDNVAEHRQDCVVFLSPKLANVDGTSKTTAEKVAAVLKYKETVARSSSYVVWDSGWKLQFDAYNNKYRKMPLNADTAGLCAQTDYTNDTWWSPAGFNRGKIKNSASLLMNPSVTDRDELYKNNINPVVTFKGDGTILYGDRTAQAKASAFSNINVRRLFIMLEKSISQAAKYQLFEFNDQFTRSAFVTMVKSVLETVKAKRGIIDYVIQCDTTNNTAAVIDANQFVASIYIKPARSINFITLNFIAVATAVEFSTVIGQL